MNAPHGAETTRNRTDYFISIVEYVVILMPKEQVDHDSLNVFAVIMKFNFLQISDRIYT